ncbi:endonuclease/exonuclease/phosphatase family protein [Desulforudis sp. 1088]|uniref:endonuclease/exonuclease/phosphatase family protein n=1 Tax=unclassified Candidatus Desulforudis TaxID=2635950 RepID=UPI003CE54BFF
MIRCMTYNIRHAEGMDGRISLLRIEEVIRQAEVHVVALQEVDRNVARSCYVDQPRTLAEALGMQSAFGANVCWDGVQQYGNAVLSRFPISYCMNYHLPGRGEQRGLLVCLLEGPRGPLTFASAHLGLSAADRRAQVDETVDILQHYPAPLVLGGDFNCRRDATELTRLYEFLQDAGSGDTPPTFPANDPQVKIDYIFTSPGFNVLELRVIETEASDHLPLIVTLEL